MILKVVQKMITEIRVNLKVCGESTIKMYNIFLFYLILSLLKKIRILENNGKYSIKVKLPPSYIFISTQFIWKINF